MIELGPCDVCRRGQAVGVACCASGPMSLAYCQECINVGACALFEFAYLFDFVSHDGEGLDPCVSSWIAWDPAVQGYISFEDYVRERLKGPICLIHATHVREWVCDECDFQEAICCEALVDNLTEGVVLSRII